MNKTLALLFVGALMASVPASAGTLDVSWTEGLMPDIIGYRLHVGTSSGDYDVMIETTDASARLENLEDERLYFLRVEALTRASKGSTEAVAISPELVTLPRPEVTEVSQGQATDDGRTWLFTISGKNLSPEAVVRLDIPSLQVISTRPSGNGSLEVIARQAPGHTFLTPPVMASGDFVVINPGRKSPEFFDRNPLRSDVDGDGMISESDIEGVRTRLGARLGETLFDRATDLNGDGRIDGSDLALLGHRLAR